MISEQEEKKELSEDQKYEWAGFKFTGTLRAGKVVSGSLLLVWEFVAHVGILQDLVQWK